MNIVLDTNIIYADFKLSGTAFRIFFEGVRRTGTNVFIPQVVIDEVVTNYEEKVNTLITDLKKLQRNAKRLTNAFEDGLSNTQSSVQIIDEYRTELLDRLNEEDVQILGYPEIAHESIVKRDLQRRRPFKTNGAGYRDTLIWETILTLLQQRQEPVVFVTRNSKDFGTGPTVLSDLLTDVTNLGFEHEIVKITTSLDDLNHELFLPKLKHLDELMKLFTTDKVPHFSLRKWLEANLREQIEQDEWDYLLAEVEIGHGTVSIESFDIRSTEIDDVRELPSGDLLVSATVEVEGWVGVDATWDDFMNYEDIRELLEEEFDESGKFSHVSTSVPFDSPIAFSLILEDKTFHVLSFDVDELNTWKYGHIMNVHPRHTTK